MDSPKPIDPILAAATNWRKHGWDGPHFAAALSIVRTEELIRQSSDRALRPLHLTHARHEALALLYFSRNGEMPLGKLSQRLLVHPTSVTSTVDTLERLGLAKRVAHPTDRRATLARITPKGRRAIEESCQAIAEAQHGLPMLDQAELAALFGILAKVRAAAGDIATGDIATGDITTGDITTDLVDGHKPAKLSVAARAKKATRKPSSARTPRARPRIA